jgi:hypothetical protein
MNDCELDRIAWDAFLSSNGTLTFTRGAVRLVKGEPAPIVMLWTTPPPDGCRWESDDEFRERIKRGDQKTPWPA